MDEMLKCEYRLGQKIWYVGANKIYECVVGRLNFSLLHGGICSIVPTIQGKYFVGSIEYSSIKDCIFTNKEEALKKLSENQENNKCIYCPAGIYCEDGEMITTDIISLNEYAKLNPTKHIHYYQFCPDCGNPINNI